MRNVTPTHEVALLAGEAICIRGVSSADFVRKVLEAYKNRRLAVIASEDSLFERVGLDPAGIVVPQPDAGWHAFEYTPSSSPDAAHVAFTSGTTGQPKSIVLSHAALADVVERLNAVMRLDADVREYVGVPVNLSFGFGRCRAVAAAGGRCFLPEHGFNPIEVADMMRAGEINAISAVPTQWRMILQSPEFIGDAGGCIRWIEIGSQYMSGAEKQRMCELFPNASIVQHYGLTEASRTTFLDIRRAEGEQIESVGSTTGGAEVRVSENGRIEIRGPHVALGEMRDGELISLTDEEGWLTTNDLGHIQDGRLFFDGRADDLINCGGAKVPSEQFESLLLDRVGLESGLAIGPATDPLRGQIVLVALEQGLAIEEDWVHESAFEIGKSFGLQAKEAIRVARCEQLPRTPTGKVKRNQLESAVMPSAQTAPISDAPAPSPSEPAQAGPHDDMKERLNAVWGDVLGMSEVPKDKSFFELGGDSLTAVNAMFQMEKQDVPAEITRLVFEGKTLQQIFDRLESGEQSGGKSLEPIAIKSNVINSTRGVLVLLVIAVHWLPGVWARLPAVFSTVHDLLHPVYRLGTPGFALVFGLGLGFFQLALFRTHAERFKAISKRNTLLLVVGVLLLAAARFGADLTSSSPGVEPGMDSSFYSVLMYYLIAVAATPLLLRPLLKTNHVVATCMLMSMVCFALGVIAKEVVPSTQTTGVLEVARLMLVAKYNVFAMTGIVLIGAAIGAAYRESGSGDRVTDLPFIRVGLTMVGFGILGCHFTNGLEAWLKTTGKEPWALSAYTGAVMLLCGVFQQAYTRTDLPVFARRFCESLAVVGILALPAFVLHEVVIPIKDIFTELGLPGALALGAPLAGFFAVMAFLYMRISGLYFSTLKSSA